MSTGPMVTTLRDRYVSGGAEIGVRVAPLAAALARRWPSDAHFQAGLAGDGRAERITRTTLERCPVRLTAIVFDLDAPGHEAREEWRDGMRSKLLAAFDEIPGGLAYDTRGGARVLWALQPEIVIANADDAREWSRRYVAACAWLGSRFSLTCDRACSDFQRLFRLPFVTRDSRPPGAVPTLGNLAEFGAFPLDEVAPAAECIAAPAVTPKASPPTRNGEASSDGPTGSLYDALDAVGLIVGPGPLPRSFLIECPRAHLHTRGSPGDGSTLLHLASWAGGSGFIACKHSHCQGLDARKWRRAIRQYATATATVGGGGFAATDGQHTQQPVSCP